MDDFHNINAVKTPTKRVLINAVHMATLLLDIQPSVNAVPRPVDHLLEELIPLCFLHYPAIVRGGQFEQLASSMNRLAIMFVAMDRHHYNKASLSWISDVQHQQENFPDYHTAKAALCSVLNEKKIEIFHSTLRSFEYESYNLQVWHLRESWLCLRGWH